MAAPLEGSMVLNQFGRLGKFDWITTLGYFPKLFEIRRCLCNILPLVKEDVSEVSDHILLLNL